MRIPSDWCDLKRLKSHLNFAQDENGEFIGSEKDLVLADCIAAAVGWCSHYTGLPLVRETLTLDVSPPSALTEPLYLPQILYPVSISGARYWADERRDVAGENATPQIGEMERIGSSGERAVCLRVWPVEAGWPDLGPGGWQVDVVKDVTLNDVPADMVSMAVIQCARDYFEAGAVMERKTAAMHLLRGVRYKGVGR